MSNLIAGQVISPTRCIALIGSEGSMGKRYQAILKHLGVMHICFDVNDRHDIIMAGCKECHGVIIATPTDTHVNYLLELIPLKIRILCEKPITKNLDALEHIKVLAARFGGNVNMVMQYAELVTNGLGPSYYNYFRHGNDSLYWDCIQIIGLAKGDLEIKESSPRWECMINGEKLSLADMDEAYISFVRSWLNGSLQQNFHEVVEMHKKTARLHDANNRGSNRDSSKIKLNTIP